jgi:hypothetical protein
MRVFSDVKGTGLRYAAITLIRRTSAMVAKCWRCSEIGQRVSSFFKYFGIRSAFSHSARSQNWAVSFYREGGFGSPIEHLVHDVTNRRAE